MCVSQTEGVEGIALCCSVAATAALPGHPGSIPAAGRGCGRDALSRGNFAFKKLKMLEGGGGGAPTPAGPELAKRPGQDAAAAVPSCLGFPTCSPSRARAVGQQVLPLRVVGGGRAVGTPSRWLPATAAPLPSVSGSSPAEVCRKRAMGLSGGRWPCPRLPSWPPGWPR